MGRKNLFYICHSKMRSSEELEISAKNPSKAKSPILYSHTTLFTNTFAVLCCPYVLNCLIVNLQGSYTAKRNRLKPFMIIPHFLIFYFRSVWFDFMKTLKLGVYLKLFLSCVFNFDYCYFICVGHFYVLRV